MRKWNVKIIAAGSLAIILATAIAAGAQQGKQVRAAEKTGIAQNLGVQEFLRGLRLTQAQREEIRSILQSYRAEILELRKELLSARLALVKEDPNGPAMFGNAQKEEMRLRMAIVAEIKGKLTPDQLAVLQERQARQIERIERMLERLQLLGQN